MESLTIRLLGIPEISLGNQALSFRTRKVLALLTYLAVEQRMHSRESLMALFWPESPSNSAAASLRVTLSRLRQGLGQTGDVLITEAGNIGFDSNYSVVLDLDWLCTAAHEETHPDELRFILTVDRGEFLEGFSLPDAPAFDDWIATQRGACLRQLETVYDRLSQHLLSVHDSAAAVETASRWVRRVPLSEQAYRRLMAAQVLNGQRPAALLTYHQLQETLKNELGLEPSRETILLANNIDQGRVGAERIDTSSTMSRISTTDQQTRLTLPLVGRTDEYSQLVESFHQIGGEKAQAVVLIGAAGVGKTRLVNAFKEWALLDTPKTEVWQGKAFETGGRLAFQPVVEALRIRLDQVNAPEDLLDDVWLAELSQLMPELRARYPDLPMPLTGNANFVRARLFESIATLGNALAAHHSSILILDDMQWADADTLDLVHYLARRWAEMKAPILLLLTVRQEAYAADPALREWLARLERDASLTRILLDNLNGTAVEELVKTLAGDGADATLTSAFGAWLWAETRGLPFFIEALLQMLIEQGILVTREDQDPTYNFAFALEHVRSVARVPLPPGVREVLRARLEGHSKEAGSLLLSAAVLERACTFERMCQIANLQENEALESLEALLDGGLLTERPSDRQPYTLAHDYIREVVYTESNEARRRVYHRRALLALEAAHEPAAECAYHALAALLDEPAFRYSVIAGSEAFASYALQDALSHFDTAREVAQRMQDRNESVDLELLESLYKQRGKILRLNQDDKAAADNYEEMRVEGVRRQSKPLKLSALIFLSNLYSHPTGVYNPQKARESGRAALVLAQELGDRAAQAHALWALQNAELYSAGDTGEIVAYGQEALALARELGLKELIAHALKNLCWPFGAQKNIEQARDELAEAQSIWRELGNLQKVAEASRLMLNFHHQAGDHRSILIDAPKLSELGASIGSRLDEVEGLAWLVITYIRQGRFSKALNYLDQYGAYAESLGYPHEKHVHQWGRIKYYLAVGALDEAGRWANDLFAERKTIPPNFIAAYFTEVVRVKIALGKLDESRNILDELLADLPWDAPFSYVIIDIALAYAEINLALGQLENIFEGLEDRMQSYRESGFGYLVADELWLRGRAALMMGQYDAACESLLKARETAEAQEERSILWKILRTMSEAEKECGNVDLAEKLLGQARLVVEDIAEHAGEVRGVFLGQPAVIQLLSKN
ncbi:MAG TPA: AAA family ATPase [Anaerolineales bacterium]|nr:AAA family ATPase [Anaerolineales bacterium]